MKKLLLLAMLLPALAFGQSVREVFTGSNGTDVKDISGTKFTPWQNHGANEGLQVQSNAAAPLGGTTNAYYGCVWDSTISADSLVMYWTLDQKEETYDYSSTVNTRFYFRMTGRDLSTADGYVVQLSNWNNGQWWGTLTRVDDGVAYWDYLDQDYGVVQTAIGDTLLIFNDDDTIKVMSGGWDGTEILRGYSTLYSSGSSLTYNGMTLRNYAASPYRWDNFGIGKRQSISQPTTDTEAPTTSSRFFTPYAPDTVSATTVTWRVLDGPSNLGCIDSLYVWLDGVNKYQVKIESFGKRDTTVTASLGVIATSGTKTVAFRAVDSSGNILSESVALSVGSAVTYKMVTYLPIWSVNDIRPSEVPWSGITHLLHFGINFADTSRATGKTAPYAPIVYTGPGDVDNEDSLWLLRGTFAGADYDVKGELDTYAKTAGVKLYVSLGGITGIGKQSLDWVTADSTRTFEFCRAAVAFANRHEYDGVEVDWEWPADNTRFRRLIRILKRQMTAQGGTCQEIGVQAAAVAKYYPNGLYVPDGNAGGIADSVEFFLWMAYQWNYLGDGFGESKYQIIGWDSPLVNPDSTQYGTKYVHFMNLTWDGYGYAMGWNGDSADFEPVRPISINSGPLYAADSLGLGRSKQVVLSASQSVVFYHPNVALDIGSPRPYPHWVGYEQIVSEFGGSPPQGVETIDTTLLMAKMKGVVIRTTDNWWRQPRTEFLGQNFFMSYEVPYTVKRKGEWIRQQGLGGGGIYSIPDTWFENESGAQKIPLISAMIEGLGATYEAPPEPPTPTSPSGTTEIVDGNPVPFFWSAVSGATSYRVQVVNSSYQILNEAVAATNSVGISIGIQTGESYYWRVRVTTSSGTSGYSAWMQFDRRWGYVAPTVSRLVSPDSSSSGQATSLWFSWNTADTAFAYHLQISNSPLFGSTFLSDTAISTNLRYVVGLSGGGTTYYWRVRAKNSAGWGAYTDYWSFTTAIPEPEVPGDAKNAVVYNGSTGKMERTLPPYVTVQAAPLEAIPAPSDSNAVNISGLGYRKYGQNSVGWGAGGGGGSMTLQQIMALFNNSTAQTFTVQENFSGGLTANGIEVTSGADITDGLSLTNGTGSSFLNHPTNGANLRYTLPADTGTARQILKVASVSGNTMTLEWAADSAGGGNAGQIGARQYDSTGIASGKILKFDGTKWAIADDQTAAGGAGDIDSIHAGDGLYGTTGSGNANLGIIVESDKGLQIVTDSLGIKLEGGTLTVGANGLRADTTTWLATQHDLSTQVNTVTAGNGLQGGGSTSAVTLDASPASAGGLEISSDSMRVKLDGATLTRGFAGMAVDTAIVASQYDLTQLGISAKLDSSRAFKWWVSGSGQAQDSIRFVQGSNITLTKTGHTLTIAAAGGGTGGGILDTVNAGWGIVATRTNDSVQVVRVDTAAGGVATLYDISAMGDLTEVAAGYGITVTSGTGPIPTVRVDTTTLFTNFVAVEDGQSGQITYFATDDSLTGKTVGGGLTVTASTIHADTTVLATQYDISALGNGTSDGQDADSIMAQRVDTVGRALAGKWTGLAYSVDSLKYKHLYQPLLDTAGTKGSTSKLYIDTDGKVKVGADNSTAGSGLGILDTVRAGWGTVVTILSDSVISLRVDTTDIATESWVASQNYLTSETGDISGVTAGSGLQGGGNGPGAVTLTADPLSAGGLQVTSDSLAIKTLGATLSVAWGGVSVDTSIIATQYDLTQAAGTFKGWYKEGSALVTDSLRFSQGANITLTQTGSVLTIASTGGGSSDGQDADSIMAQRVDTTGRALAGKWTALAYSVDSLKYKHRYSPLLDTAGTKGATSKLYIDTDGKVKVGTDNSTAGSGLGILDTVNAGWGIVASRQSDSVQTVRVDTAAGAVASQSFVTSQGYLTSETGDISGVTAGSGLQGGGTGGAVTLTADPASAGGLQVSSDSLAIKPLGATLGVAWGGVYVDTAIIATQYDISSFITGVTAGDGLHGTSTHDAAPASAGGLQITSDSLAVKRLGNTLSSAWGGLSVDTSIVGTFYGQTQLVTGVTAGANAQIGGTEGTVVVDVVPLSAGGLEGSNDSLQVKLNGATLSRTWAGMAVDTSIVASQYDLTTIPLNQIANPTATKQFSMGAYGLEFLIANPTSPALSIEGTGNFTDDLLHIHQNTGNPTTGSMLLHLESVDTDPLNLYSTSANDTNATFAGGRVHTDSIQTKGIRVDSVANLFTAAAGQGWLYGRGASGLFYQYQGGRIRVDSTWTGGAGVKAWYTEGGAVNVDSLRFAAGSGISFTQSGNRLTITNNGADNTDSLVHKFVDSTGRAVANYWTVPAYRPDTNKYKSVLVYEIDTTNYTTSKTNVGDFLTVTSAGKIGITQTYQTWLLPVDSSMIKVGEAITIGRMPANMQIDSVSVVGEGTTSVTFNILYGLSRATADDSLFNAIQTANNAVQGNLLAVDDGDLSLGQWMWLRIQAVTTQPTELAVWVRGRLR